MENTRDSFKNRIVNCYGAVVLNKVKEFVKLRIKCKKLECGLSFVIKCRDNGVIPKFVRIKPVRCTRDYASFFKIANMKLLRRVIVDYRRNLMCTHKRVYELHLCLSSELSEDLWTTLDGMSYSRSMSLFTLTELRHEKKLRNLISEEYRQNFHNYPRNVNDVNNIRVETHNTRENVVNLSTQQLSEDAISALTRGLNFAPAPRRIPVEDIVASVEDTLFRNKIPHMEAECIRQDISSILRRSRPPRSNLSSGELSALRELRHNTDVLVLPADKGNATVVVDTLEYERRISLLVSDSNTYRKVDYNPTSRVTAKVVKLLRDSDSDMEGLAAKLYPRSPITPKIYGLPKIHKPDWPLRPIVSQIDAPTYLMAKHIAGVLQPLTGKTSSYVRDSAHFVQLLADVSLSPDEVMVSFDVASLFTNVPVDEALGIITELIVASDLPTVYVDWTSYCLKNGYFVWRGEFFLQIDGVAMGSPLAPVVANIYMEWFENRVLTEASSKPRYWWRYVDDVFAIISRNVLEEFTSFLNTVHGKIQFTVEEEEDGSIPFLDVRVIRKPDGKLSHTVYRKPTHTDRYLRADSHHHISHLASVPRSLIGRALRLCDPEYVQEELDHVRRALEGNGYCWSRCRRWANPDRLKRPEMPGRSPVYLPFVKGVTDKIGRLLDRRCGIRARFRPPGKLRQLLRSPKDKEALCGPGVYKIPCDCGRSYIGETQRNISTRITEHIRAVKNMETDRSAVAEHAYISDSKHYLRFDKVSVLAKEKFFVPRKFKEAIEIGRYANFNRDRGWAIPSAWMPVLSTRDRALTSVRECDTTSAVCLQPNDASDISGSDSESADPPPAPSQRSVRAAARALASERRLLQA